MFALRMEKSGREVISMLKNNNTEVVFKMAKKTLKNHKRRTLTMILAVLLSAFMLFTVLTVGVTFFKTKKLENLRLNGADFDAILYGVTQEQMEICTTDSRIQKIGICGIPGYIQETEFDSTPNVGLIYADRVYWEEMMEPVREWVKGHYPKEANELMVTEEALESCGLEGLGVGDTFTMTYNIPAGDFEETFRISGIWDGYGDTNIFYVSEKFYENSGRKLAEAGSGRCFMKMNQKIMTVKEQEKFIEKLNLGKAQRCFFTIDMGNSVEILAGMFGMILVICLCAYLLIYNILYLSVAGNIRHYGLLQTIGMTGRQIRRYMRKQMLLVGGIGTAGGILLGCVISFFLIPTVVKTLGVTSSKVEKITVSFHPFIFFLTLTIIGITIWVASRRPVKIAVESSPIEALGYRSVTEKRKHRKSRHGSLAWRMAKEQLGKDKKKAGVVILALASGMIVFLCMITLLTSEEARSYIFHYRDVDMILENDTVLKERQEDRKQIFDEAILEKMKKTKGVAQIDPIIYTEITVPWEPEFTDLWMREFYETWMDIPYEQEKQEYQEYPENFGSSLVGITEEEFRDLNASLEEPIDEDAFLNGKTCLLYRNGLSFKKEDVAGKNITCTEYGNLDNQLSFDIAGLVDLNDYTALLGYPPTIIVSDTVVKSFVNNPVVYKLEICYEKSHDQETEASLLSIMEETPYKKDYSYDSKIKLEENVKKAQGNMMEIGIGIVLILAFIGIMNYLNTAIGSIQSRIQEIAVMESIGMTGKQVQKMLMLEGFLYATGAIGVTMTLGLAVTYCFYEAMNYNGAPFQIPVIPVSGVFLLSLVICMIVPVLVYRSMEKKTQVVERIKGTE